VEGEAEPEAQVSARPKRGPARKGRSKAAAAKEPVAGQEDAPDQEQPQEAAAQEEAPMRKGRQRKRTRAEEQQPGTVISTDSHASYFSFVAAVCGQFGSDWCRWEC
jgi:hypothetical protein